MMRRVHLELVAMVVLFCLATFGPGATAGEPGPAVKVGERVARRGDEIMVCGQLFHTTAPVVLWTDPGGYDAYRVERRFVPLDQASWAKTREADLPELRGPNRYGTRLRGLSPDQVERVRGGGWDLDTLKAVVDQFVIHFDARGTSKNCFEVLHDRRGLSVHFMLDLDGTIYQTLDVKERAWHATIANDRSVGVEIANIGAFPLRDEPGKGGDPLARWYRLGDGGRPAITIPGGVEGSGLRDRSKPLRPARGTPVVGTVQGQQLRQYDLTAAQYDSLIRLTATLCTIFPKIRCDYPRDPSGRLINHKLPNEQFARYEGILGHYHVQTNKVDPGPAFQWDTVVDGARKLMAR
jgi:hypothetical protein